MATSLTVSDKLTIPGFVARVLYPMFVVFATYNTSGHSYYHWLIDYPDQDLILKVCVGGMLGFAYYNIGETTAVALQRTGLLISIVTCASGAWYLIDQGWVVIDSRKDLINAMQLTVVVIMSIGLSYAHIHSRVGGVKMVEEGRNIP